MSARKGGTLKIVFFVAVAVLFGLYMFRNSGARDGKSIFKGEGCTTCHKFKDTGSGTIDLSNITKKRSDTWIEDQVKNPRSHDPNTGMPSFPHLSDEELKALIGFMHSEG